MIIDLQEFFKLRENLPVIDVRSENEFTEGHIQRALNIPILNNEERIAVGTDYKKKGQLEAIKTGFRLVGPRIIDIVNQAEAVAKHRELLVHCWRGGMRSSNFCQFVEMAKIETHQLKGGYKTYRQAAYEAFSQPIKFIVVGGYTGSGKSEILNAIARSGEQVIDLEKLAHHKGSAFGGLLMPPQPTTEQFQNNLFEKIRSLDVKRRIWIEDESITIGKIVLPEMFWKSLTSGALIEIQLDKQTRVERLANEYGKANPEDFLRAMSAVVKKLGGQHYQAAQQKYVNDDLHGAIDILLNYYDKAYNIGLLKKKDRLKFTIAWNGKEVERFADELVQTASRQIIA